MHGKNVLITGATSGLGYEFAKLCATKGHELFLVSRSEEKLTALSEELQQAYGAVVHYLAVDLTSASAAGEVYLWTQELGQSIEILINNAGMGTFGIFHDAELEKELQMISLNITSVAALSSYFLQDMKEKNRGRILNIGSIAGFQPVPLFSGYAATKAFVNSFSQSLSYELRGSNITVSVLCPGPFKSGFEKEANMGDSKNFDGLLMSAEKIAAIGYHGLHKGKRVIVPSLIDKLQIFVQRLVPRSLVIAVAASKVALKKSYS